MQYNAFVAPFEQLGESVIDSRILNAHYSKVLHACYGVLGVVFARVDSAGEEEALSVTMLFKPGRMATGNVTMEIGQADRFTWDLLQPKMGWKLRTCYVDKKRCHSLSQWQALVRPYLED